MIKNLELSLNEHGKIKIGRKGEVVKSAQGNEFRQPERIDHFIITTAEKDSDGKFIEDIVLMDRLKQSNGAILNKDGNIIGIPVRFLYSDIELNFPTRLASYQSGKLFCYGDNELAQNRISDFKQQIQCPCDKRNPDYGGNDKCKPNGTMTCMIDDVAMFGQIHKFRTTSINSIRSIMAFVELINAVTKRSIAGLPLMLIVTNKTTTTPSGAPTTIQVVSLCFNGDMSRLRDTAMQLAETDQKYLLDMGQIEKSAKESGAGNVIGDEEDEQDFIEEFVPEAVVIDTTSEDIPVPEKNIENTVVIPVAKPLEIELMEKLDTETDIDKVIALANRITKPVLYIYLVKRFPKKTFFESTLKPALIDLLVANIKETLPSKQSNEVEPKFEIDFFVGTPGFDQMKKFVEIASLGKQIDLANAMTNFFRPEPIDRTQSIPDLLATATRKLKARIQQNEQIKKTEKSPETQSAVGINTPSGVNKIDTTKYQWDAGKIITKDQKLELQRLKNQLQINVVEWPKLVSQFKDKDNNPLTTAIHMTLRQADEFIDILIDRLKNSKK